MQFTKYAYAQLLELLRTNGYNFCSYNESESNNKSCILRHDIDFSIGKALEMAMIEHSMNVKSTYFVLLTSNFYNVFSKQSFEKLQQIMSLGHEIGLHFDEQRYDIKTVDEIKKNIESEAEVLSRLLNHQIKVVSMHRPSKFVLENDLHFDLLINSYSSKYQKHMKYISDSRMNWRENLIQLIESGLYKKLHILTHSFWYSTSNESLEHKLKEFLKQAIGERYDHLDDNFRDLDQLINREEIHR